MKGDYSLPVITWLNARAAARGGPDQEMLIEPRRRRGDAVILLRRALRCKQWSERVPRAFRTLPSLDVYTCADSDWTQDLPGSSRRMKERCTTIFFRDRSSFSAAYQAARQIAAGRPAFCALHQCTFVLLAPAHRLLARIELAAAHMSADADDLYGTYHARSACRCCGYSEEAMGYLAPASPGDYVWEEPDLCFECHLDGRELGKPAGGFQGLCDGCGQASTRLRLITLTQHALCPGCRRKTRSRKAHVALRARLKTRGPRWREMAINDELADADAREEAARGY